MSTSRSAPSFTLCPPGPLLAPSREKSEYGLVGNSVAMRRLRLQVRRIGPHFRTVLVSGEPGTGKELVARALHRMSPAADGPFVVCHASAIEEAVAEWEAGVNTG